MLPQSSHLEIFLKKAFHTVRTSPRERGWRRCRWLATNDQKCEESDRHHFELPLSKLSHRASLSSSRQKWSTAWQEAMLLLLQAHKAGCHLPTSAILSPWQLMISSSKSPGMPNRMQESLCVVRDIPSAYTWSVYCSESQTASVSTYSKWTDESVCVSILSIKAGSRKFCLRSRSVNISWNLWL